ncbi:caspase family protein [Streptomyces sp. TLI_146]|uniref:caspase, EACC1-associated type n=1 Tax=Streptomyces sp. TLI_146 TaxID=1938858 RepID=UPI000C7097E8|nr:caspase family protein [Streptomyces sp. TLI_146]
MTDPAIWGLPEEQCVVLQPSHAEEVLDQVYSLVEKTKDTFVLYYAGHGLLDMDGNDRLHLAMPKSSSSRPYRSLSYSSVVSILRNPRSGAERNIVILDCCYSGAASADGMGAKSSPPEEAPVEGIFLLTATKRNEQARSPGDRTFTDFTAELLALLSDGIRQGPPLLDLATLHAHLYTRMRLRNKTHPQLVAPSSAARLALARNCKYREPLPGTAPEQSARDEQRLGKVIGGLVLMVAVAAVAVAIAVLGTFMGEDAKGGRSSESSPAADSMLRGSRGSFTGNVDLSEEGRIDWVQWGYLPKDRNVTAEFSGGPAESECRQYNVYCVTRRADSFVIGDYRALGTEAPVRLHASRQPVSFSWRGGAAPNQSASEVRSVVYQGGPGAGFRILVPTTARTRVFRL